MQSDPAESLTLTPIGYIRTGKRLKFDTPHQPIDGVQEQNIIELHPGKNFEQALQDLKSFDRIWVVWWFHKNKLWRPLVLPPRGPAHRRGLFATRSPHRPNPIGLTAVPLIAVGKRSITIGNCDLLDGTPILDIKPYVATVDAFPQATLGWLAEVEDELKTPARFTIEISPLAAQQLDWLAGRSEVSFIEKGIELLKRDPKPHRTRRIRRRNPGKFLIGCGTWKLIFVVSGSVVTIEAVEPGYPKRLLIEPSYEVIPDRDAQLVFIERWGDWGRPKG